MVPNDDDDYISLSINLKFSLIFPQWRGGHRVQSSISVSTNHRSHHSLITAAQFLFFLCGKNNKNGTIPNSGNNIFLLLYVFIEVLIVHVNTRHEYMRT